MRAGALGWHDEQEDEERRRIRKAVSISIGIHVALFAALVISPPSSLSPMPQTISVELVAGPRIAPPAAPKPSGRAKPPPPKAPEPPAPEAAPEPPPPPIAKAPVQVLPENAPKPDKKVKQAPEKKPKEAAKPEPTEKPAEKPPPKPPEKDLSYEDAMKSLDEELGEDETEDLLARAPARPNVRRSPDASGAAESSSGVKVDPALAAWHLETKRLIQSKWVTLPNFRGRGLKTGMELRLSATGDVIGEPRVTHPSEDPYFDDNAVRAVLSVSPLPAPPRAGTITFIFSSEE